MENWKVQKIKEALYPKSVAVIGISDNPNNLGAQAIDALVKH